MNKRQIFRAIFKGYALKTYQDHYTPAMVLGDVQTQQQLILRECTLTYTKQMQKLGFLMPGTILQFSARVNHPRLKSGVIDAFGIIMISMRKFKIKSNSDTKGYHPFGNSRINDLVIK